MVEISVAYEGDLSCKATHGPSNSTLVTDAPVDNQGLGRTFSPTDLVAAALGACMLTILGIVARRHQLSIEGARVRVEKHMVTTPVRRIGRLPVFIRVPGYLTADQRQMIDNAVRTCPVHRSLHPDIEIPIAFQWD